MKIALLSTPSMSRIAKSVTRTLQANTELRKEGFEYRHTEINTTTFEGGEIMPEVPETLRSAHAYLFHCPYWPDVNTGLLEDTLAANAIRLASAESLKKVLLGIPYMRQDRKDEKNGRVRRVPISAKVIAEMIYREPIMRDLITFDLHAEQEEAFFPGPVQNLPGRRLFADYFRAKFRGNYSNVVVCSTDVGGSKRVERFAHLLDEDMLFGIIRKSRKKGSKVKNLGYIGDDVRGKIVILLDDLISTGNSIIAAYLTLMRLGAKEVIICATHGIFTADEEGTAESKFAKLGIKVIILDTIPRSPEYLAANKSWLKVLPTDAFLARVIGESHRSGGSINSLRA